MTGAVIFDWDGTLADTKKVVVRSFQSALEKVNCHVRDGFIAKLIGIGSKKTIEEALRVSGIVYDDQLLTKLVKEKIQREIELSDEVRLFDGAVELLDALRDRCRMALASMNNRAVIDDLLNKKSIAEYFNVVVTADEVVNPKPNPEIFLKCAERLNSTADQCVVIEDSLFGVKAAKNAGMKCIGVFTGSYGRKDLEEERPALIVEKLSEKTKILNFIFASTD